jgi:Heparinase II/III-like protein/Heparinase II/III N-terminus
MGRDELFDRTRQFLVARLDAARYRTGKVFARTTKTAPEGANRVFFFAPADVPALCAALRQYFPAQAGDIVSRAENICRHRFDLLGYQNLDYGAEIDWHLDVVHGKRSPRRPWYKVKYLEFTEVGDAKITWELNRHQHFVTLAKAFCLTRDEKFARELFAQWTHWRQENPYPIGINWASSLEVAYRSLSWIWTFFLLQESPLFAIDLRKQWKDEIDRSGRHIETYLSTYFSPNTHLLGEALALFFIGTLFPGLQSSARWRRLGWEILEREAKEQVREDGFYFEQSTYYHVYALDIFLHARILAMLNGIEISSGFDRVVQGMLDALRLLGRAGLTPSLGDDDGGRLFDGHRNRSEHLIDPLATGAILYRRGDFKLAAGCPREETLWLLGVKGLADFESLPGAASNSASTTLSESGLYLMVDEDSGAQLLIDGGPLGAGSGGHGHADALSVCLEQEGRHLLIDPGTFEYVGDSGERSRLRGTAAHNTIQIDGLDQAEQSGPFSWERFPEVTLERWITGHEFDLYRGAHDGYSMLPSPVTHHRWVFHRNREFWMIRDLATGSGLHQLDLSWHAGLKLSSQSSGRCKFVDDRGTLALLGVEDGRWSQDIYEDHWSPVYGSKEPASVIKFGGRIELPADFATVIIARSGLSTDTGRLVRINGSVPGTIGGYRYSNSRCVDDFFFVDRSEPWVLGDWASDAEFLYWSVDRERERFTLILCEGTYADAGGRRVLNCSRRVKYVEVLSSAGKVELGSSAPESVVLEQPLAEILAKP